MSFRRIAPLFLVVVLVLSLTVLPVSAASAPLPDNVPDPGDTDGVYYKLVAIYKDYSLNRYRALYVKGGDDVISNFAVVHNESAGRYEVTVTYTGTVATYTKTYQDNGSWAGNGYYDSASTVFYVASADDMYYSSRDIVYSDGAPFFPIPPVPLAVQILEVVRVTIPSLMSRLGGTIMILALCGVGSMALLMVLKLFGPALLRFLH